MTSPKPPSPFTVTGSRIAWECPWYAIRQDDLILPDGRPGVYNVVDKCDAVWIVPITPTGEIALIHNYRHTLGEWCWELPAGGIKAGQTPLKAAQAELLEEIGGTAESWRFLLRAATMNGLGSEIGHFFLATGVTLDTPQPEPTEAMTVHVLPLAEAVRMARTGAINDALSITALLLAVHALEDGAGAPD